MKEITTLDREFIKARREMRRDSLIVTFQLLLAIPLGLVVWLLTLNFKRDDKVYNTGSN